MPGEGNATAGEPGASPAPDGATAESSPTDPLAATVAGTFAPPQTASGSDATQTTPTGEPNEVGLGVERVGRYRVLRKLGAGGMGVVYLAHDDDLDRPVAIKLLRPDGDGDPARLLREARSMARLAHPNVTAVFDVGTHGGDVFIAMEFVEGQTLQAFLAGSPDWAKRRDVLLQAARGLAAAHKRGIVHRDFKPDNVMVGADGRVRVLDFGLAKGSADRLDGASRAPSTAQGRLMGTPRYMSPEQLRCEPATVASDQFAYCVTAYEAAYGGRPFEGEVFAEIAASVLGGTPRVPEGAPDIPPALWDALARGLNASPDERFPTMQHLVAALERVPEVAVGPSRPDLRDARAGAHEKLAGAYAENLLDVDELDGRLERLEDATSPATVNRLVADLEPAPQVQASTALAPIAAAQTRLVAVFSQQKKGGGWTPAARNEVICVLGSAVIDLRMTDLPPVTRIEAKVLLGNIEIFVPPGVAVQSDAIAILGSTDIDDPAEPLAADAPQIHIGGFVLLGSITVRERELGEGRIGAWSRRRRAMKEGRKRKALRGG